MALAVFAVALFWLWPRRPGPPVHPLGTIAIADVRAASLDGVVVAPGSPGFAALAALPARLARTPPAPTPFAWVNAHVARLDVAGGTILWLQLADQADGAMVRVTADAAAGAPAAARSRAKAIRALRLRAYHVPRGAVPQLGARVAPPSSPTGLSTKNKARLGKDVEAHRQDKIRRKDAISQVFAQQSP